MKKAWILYHTLFFVLLYFLLQPVKLRGAEKLAQRDSSPSQSFLTRLTETSRRLGSSMLYTLDGVTPARLASSLGLMLRSLQI